MWYEKNHLAVAVERKPRPLISPSGRRLHRDALAVASNIAPQLIELNKSRTNIANLAIEYAPRIFSGCVHQRQDRFDMQASQPRYSANAGSFKHHRESTNGGVRVGIMFAQFGNISGERSTAGSTAVALNLAFSVEAETLHGIMLATFAGHIGLDFPAGQADDCFASALRLTPRAEQPRCPVHAGAGHLLWLVPVGGFGPPLSASKADVLGRARRYRHKGGIQGFTPKNALRLFSHWWVSHSRSPFAWIGHLKSFFSPVGLSSTLERIFQEIFSSPLAANCGRLLFVEVVGVCPRLLSVLVQSTKHATQSAPVTKSEVSHKLVVCSPVRMFQQSVNYFALMTINQTEEISNSSLCPSRTTATATPNSPARTGAAIGVCPSGRLCRGIALDALCQLHSGFWCLTINRGVANPNAVCHVCTSRYIYNSGFVNYVK